MICGTSGKVTKLIRNGFLIINDFGNEQEIRTFAHGWDLDIRVGDEVNVLGGPAADGDYFATPSISKRCVGQISSDSEWAEARDSARQQSGISLRSHIRYYFRRVMQRL